MTELVKLSKVPTSLSAAYLLMWAVMFTLPFFSVEGYSMLANTTSELGAQNTPNAWIMNLAFVSLAISTVVSGWGPLWGLWVNRLVLLLFSVCLLMTTVFRHAPLIEGTACSLPEDELHSLFANLTGFSFTLFAVSCACAVNDRQGKLLALAAGTLAMVLSFLMFAVDDYRGVWQRLIFICSFGWMIHLFAVGRAASISTPQPGTGTTAARPARSAGIESP